MGEEVFYSYARSRPQVRPQIVRRIAAGERLSHICREPGMPCPESVTGWMRREPAFAAEVAEARVRGEWRRRFAFDEDRARALLARLGAGEPIGRILRDPGMPSRETYYRHWLMSGPAWFQQGVWRIRQAREAARRGPVNGRFRAFDPVVAEKIYVRLWKGETLRAILRSDRMYPSLAVLARWRREAPEFDRMLAFVFRGWKQKRARERCLCTPEMTEAIVARIVEGGSLRSLAQEPGMPSQGAMYNWVRTRPEFAEAVAGACEDREDWYRDAMVALLDRAGPQSQKAITRLLAPLSRQETRLRKRPGWKRRGGR